MGTRTIRRSVRVGACPNDVHDSLMTTRGPTGFTGAPPHSRGRVEGKFMARDGYLHGTNFELGPGRKIVPTRHPTDATRPDDGDPQARFSLTTLRGGTQIRFTHSGVPVAHSGQLPKGWQDLSGAPPKEYLET